MAYVPSPPYWLSDTRLVAATKSPISSRPRLRQQVCFGQANEGRAVEMTTRLVERAALTSERHPGCATDL